MAVTSFLVALGSNRRSRHGAPARTIRAAIEALGGLGAVVAVTTPSRSPAMGPAGRSFDNVVAVIESALSPAELLIALKAVERSFGRRRGRRWGARVLDLDIILWSGGIAAGPGLAVPHPGFRTRRFVLDPAAQLAPDWRDPVTGLAVRHLAHRLTARRPKPTSPRVGS